MQVCTYVAVCVHICVCGGVYPFFIIKKCLRYVNIRKGGFILVAGFVCASLEMLDLVLCCIDILFWQSLQ